MLGERAGFSTGSPWSVTKGFSPALCFLLVMKASPYLADRAALCSSLSLSSALSCPACFLPVVVINFPELYSSKSLEEPFGNGSTPRRLSLICPNKIWYCIYNLTWTFCIQPSWSLGYIHTKFGLYTVFGLLPNKYHYSHIIGGKPQHLAIDQEMEAELEKETKWNLNLLPTASTADDFWVLYTLGNL